MQDNDLISRAAAIDALTDKNLRRNVDSVCDGDMNRTRRAAQRVIAQLPTVDAALIVRCRDCKHKKLDGPSTCKSIINKFYCDEKLGWCYQYEGEPDILDWFCADGERAETPTCGPDYCEIGGDDDADGEQPLSR